MNLSIVLPLRNQAELTSLLKRLYDPSSPDYQHFLSVEDFKEQFAPTASDYQAVVAFAKSNGFTVKGLAANQLVVPVTGTVDQVQKTFQVRMLTYQHPIENRTFFSPDRAPSIPVGLQITHVAGMDNYSIPKSLVVKSSNDQGAGSASVLGSGPGGAYLSSDMRAAYYGGTELTGSGQTVALVQFDGYAINDVVATFGGTATATNNGSDNVINYTPAAGGPSYSIPVHNVLLDGATGAPGQFQSSGDVEQAVDIAQAIGMAPGLSQVRVYIGKSDTDILNAIASENIAKQVSISWSWTQDNLGEDDVFFQEMAVQGQSVFAASGDDGELDEFGQWIFPAEDTWVTSVGGTSLKTTGSGGTWASEVAWDRSGGGFSENGIQLPAWQAGVANPSNMASPTQRNIPDIAAEANTDNYACNLGSCEGTWGGTSFAAPRWAGLAALINQQTAVYGEPAVGFLNPWIYSIAEGPQYGTTFHDIVVGNNAVADQYGFQAVAGYDLVTGWGTPNGQALIDALVPPVTQGFYVSVSPSNVSLGPGSSVSVNVRVTYVGGFALPVSLSISGLPQGVSASFSPQTTNTSSTLTLTAGANIVGGVVLVQLSGTAGTIISSASIPLTVDGPSVPVLVTSPAIPLVPPFAQWFKPGAPISVNGTVVGGYQNLRLEWAEGVYPASGWTANGISLAAATSSESTLTDELIGTWDTSSISNADYYTIRITVDLDGVTQTSSTLIYLEPSLLSPNWPQVMNNQMLWMSGPITAQDASGNTRLVVDTYNELRSFSSDGSSEVVLPMTQSWTQAAAANLNLGVGDEIVGGDLIAIDVFNPDGTSSQLSYKTLYPYANYYTNQPILEDIDGDSLLEVIEMGTIPLGQGIETAYVFAWRNNGNLVDNFPIAVPDLYNNMKLNNPVCPRVLVGDVVGDGNKEILVIEGTTLTSFTPRLFGADGSALPWNAPTIANDVPEQILFADLDHNGELETVMLTAAGSVHVLQPDGSERAGWPRQVPAVSGTLAVGDLDQSGNEEIVVSAANIYVFNVDGTQFPGGWPLIGSYGPAILADVNNDGFPEIVTSIVTTITNAPPGLWKYNSGQLVVLDRLTHLLRSWNLPGGKNQAMGQKAYPTVGDFNNSGTTDIAVAYGLMVWKNTDVSFQSELTVLSTGASYNAAANDWPMLNRNSRNTSVLRRAASSNISLTPSANPSTGGKQVIFTLAVTGVNSSYIPSGKANLLDGATNIGSCQLVSGSCSIQETLATGQHSLVAGYVGDVNFWESLSSPLIETMQPIGTSARPAFSVAPGTYTSAQPVSITDSTPGAAIYYTTNGSAPTTGSTLYSGAIAVPSSETIQAIATASGYSTSAVASAAYTINPPAARPAFSVAPGTYTSAQPVSITDSTPGAAIYYTTNGSAPTTGSTLYSGAITVSSSETIQAIATASGYPTSAVASAAYTINTPANSVPVISNLSPGFTSAGSTAFTLAVNGSGFTTSSTVYWGATALATQYLSATQLTAQVTAADIASAGATAITVQTPSPSGGTSNSFEFEVDSTGSGTTAPTITPTTATVAAGSTASYPVTLPSTVTSATTTCLNLPTGATCSYSSTTNTVTITTSSTTPQGIYQVTVVFSETVSGAATAGILLPFLLLPLMFMRKRLATRGIWTTACLGLVLITAAAFSTGCGGGGSASTTPPPTSQTHQVTSSGSVSLAIQ